MKLSAKTRYASRILLDLALSDNGSPQRVQDIAERTGITVPFIEQIIKPLKHAGLVVSKRGASGGHQLGKSTDSISLGDIVRIMEGSAELSVCLSSPERCARAEGCPTRAAWRRATDAMLRELDAITVADLMRNGHEGCLGLAMISTPTSRG
ncbi:MAG: Rrf2 family transcriptional regulator [Deltaproteobacteria bacterium]|nr:Rrf2 family transcriptional regulator [Deltaproteobacteria bacterium]